jgi:hypothetical protein
MHVLLRVRRIVGALLVGLLIVGCSDGKKSSSTVGSAGPSLDAPTAEERAAAAREAAQKYGAKP